MELQWELMVFTLFMCLSAGVFAVQGLLAFMGKGKEIQMPALIVTLVSLAIGGIGSFLHLQHWERIFNGFGHLTSGITQELIAIVVFFIVMVVYFFLLRKSDDGLVPKWCGIVAIVISVVLVVIMSHSYYMAARPAWNTPIMWLYYLGNAALFGSLTVMLLMGVKGVKNATLNMVGIVSGAFSALMTLIYTVYLMMSGSAFTDVENYFDPTMPTKEMVNPEATFNGLMTGETALLFWLGVIIVGLVVPLVALILGRKKEPKQIAVYAGVGLVAALIGGMCFRVILYILGSSVFLFY